jgi:hypothetical protein
VVCVPRLDASSVDALEAGAFEVLTEDSSPERIAQVVEAVLGCGTRGVVAGR